MYLWVIKCNYCYRFYKTIVVLRQHKVEKEFHFLKNSKGRLRVILDACVLNPGCSFAPHLSF